MNHFLNHFPTQRVVFMLLLGIMLSCACVHDVLAQTSQLPFFTISSEGASNGAVQQGMRNILLRERRLTFMTYDALPQQGYIVIRRISGSSATVTLRLGIAYQDIGNRFLPDFSTDIRQLPSLYTSGNTSQRLPVGVTTSSVAINSLQGDLQPFLFLNNLNIPIATIGTTQMGINQIVFSPQVQVAIIRFTARWSDQSYPRNPGIQEQRTVVVSLLPGDGYDIPTGFNALSRITLEDPENVPPIALPAARRLCDQLAFSTITPTAVEQRFEIESPLLDSTGMPRSLFYDDNYDPMSYSANTNNARALAVRVENADSRFQNQPSLYALPNSTVRSTTLSVTIFARDNQGGFAETTCSSVSVMTNVREHLSTISFSAAPNPASTETRLFYSLQEPSSVLIEVYSPLGERLISIDEGPKPRGEYATTLNVERLATGVYPVRIRAGRELKSVMMRVVR